jgi:hypothetical protein
MRLTFRFVDGSIDDETTTYRQQGRFRLVRNHHIQKGPFFTKPGSVAKFGNEDLLEKKTVSINATNPFKGRQYSGEMILTAVRWYLRYPLAYEHVSELLERKQIAP